MMRITRKDLMEIEFIREEMKDLEKREKALRERLLAAGLAPEHPIKVGDRQATLIEYKGTPAVKEAFIKLAGEDVYGRLRRPTHLRLIISTV